MKRAILYIIMIVITSAVFSQTVFTVTKSTDPDPFLYPFDNDDDLCAPEMLGTLQWAINKANYSYDESIIIFDIPGSGPHEIILNRYLPQIKHTTTIDATSQPGYTLNNPAIILNGENKFASGFDAYMCKLNVKGMNIKDFGLYGIVINQGEYSEISDNIIAIDRSNKETKTPVIGVGIINSKNITLFNNIISVYVEESNATRVYGVYISKSEYCTIGSIEDNKANTIFSCRNGGILLASSNYIKISGNRFFDNGKAINSSNSNNGMQPPEITFYEGGVLKGTSLPNSTIEIFGSTGNENANEHLTTAMADGMGNWSTSITTTYDYFITTATDGNNNTSVLSNAFMTNNLYHEETYWERVQNFEEYYIHLGDAKWDRGTGYKQYQRWRAFTNPRLDDNDNLVETPKIIKEYYDKETRSDNTNGNWTFKGPVGLPPGQSSHQSGKGWVWSLDVNPENRKIIYAGGHHGGVWKTTDGGDNWIPLTDDIGCINGVNSIAVNYGGAGGEDEVYITTTTHGGSVLGYAYGVFKSEDGGNTWIDINNGLTNQWGNDLYPSSSLKSEPRKIILHPSDYNKLYFIAHGYVFKSDNKGASWTMLKDDDFWWWARKESCLQDCGVNTTGLDLYDEDAILANCYGDPAIIECAKQCPHYEFGWRDIEVLLATPNNPETIIVSGSNVIKSEDDGLNWIDITTNVTTGLTDPVFGGELTQVVRCEASSNNNEFPGNAWFIFNFDDTNYLARHETANPEPYRIVANGVGSGYYTTLGRNCNECEVSINETGPTGEPVVYIAGVTVGRFEPNATTELTWLSSTSRTSGLSMAGPDKWIHADIRHLEVFDDGGTDILFAGHDGGLSFGEDIGACGAYWCWYNIADDGTNGLQVTEFYGIAGVDDEPELLLGGTQDMGCFVYSPDHTPDWIHSSSGDGAKGVEIDYTDTNNMYQLDYFNGGNGRIQKSNNKGQTFGTQYSGITAHPYSPLVLHPSDPSVLYIGERDKLSRFTEVPDNWTIEPVNPPGNNSNITAIDISVSNPNIGFTANNKYIWGDNTVTGRFWKSIDLNSTTPTWTDIGSADLAAAFTNGYITAIEINPNDENEVWISFCRYSNAPKVYHTTDGGTSWVAFADGLPNKVPVMEIKYDYSNEVLYAATDVGVFCYDDELSEWVNFSNNLPFKLIFDLEINEKAQLIRAGTFGRGIWESNLMCKYKSTPLEITSNETWNSDVYMQEDLIVNAGITLTIKSNVYMPSEAEIIVERGARLIIDGGRITDKCGDLWKGIVVQGTHDSNQFPYSNQGYIQLKNGAIIENANKAILAEGGAVVRASGSTFLNNRNDVWLEPYTSPSYPNMNYSYFTSCEFKTEGQLNDITKYPVIHLRIDNVSGIIVKNCHFSNDRTHDFSDEPGPLYANYRGIGILAIDSDFKVIPNCATIQQYGVPCPSPLRNTFEGLYYGIKAKAINSSATVTIKQSDFTHNYRGLLLENINTPSVFLNTFDADYSGVGTNLYQIYPPPYSNSTYSMYLNNCQGYRVEENEFKNGDAGLFLYQSGETAHEIYKNTFENIDNHGYASGITALGKNSDITGNIGLEFYCNTFNTNNYNMSLIGEGSSIKQIQGEYSNATGNTLDHNCLDSDNSDFYLAENSLFSHYAYYHGGDPLFCTNMDFQTQGADNGCESNLDDQSSIEVLQFKLAALGNNSESAQNELKGLIDGGNTELMLSVTENLGPNNFNKSCDILIASSPYLSDEVLVSFMQANVNGKAAKKKDVLLANSPLPENAKQELHNYWLPPPFKQMVEDAQNGINPIKEKELEISSILTERQSILNKAIAYSLYNDSILEYQDTIIDILLNEDYYTAKYYLIPLLISREDFAEATIQLANFESEVSDMSDNIKSEILNYIEYLTIVKDFSENNNDENIIANNISFLENLAETDNVSGSIGAQIMLENYSDDYDYPEKIYIIEPEFSSKSLLINSDNTDENNSFTENFNIYPNPANNNLIVEYEFENTNNTLIKIYNLQGQLIKSIPITSQKDKIVIDVSDFSEGDYLITICCGESNKFTKQISIVH